MCGVVAVLHDPAAGPVDREVVGRMTRRLAHRGPDGEGLHVDGAIGLGHRRLVVIDPAAGQPLADEAGTRWLVCAGEIYNFRDLRERLIAAGHRLRTRGDAEVILHLYEEHGDEVVDRLEGDFAFVLWDGARRRLLAARDRLGVKPLFWAPLAAGVALASEEKALLAHPGVDARVDDEAVQDYLFAGRVLLPRTMYAGIRELEPGARLTCEAGGGPVVRRWWDVPLVEPAPGALDEARERVTAAVRRAVAQRLVADVPLGSALSGGLDSSVVVAHAAPIVPGLPTFTVRYAGGAEHFQAHPAATVDGRSSDDAGFARQVAAAFGTDHREIELTAEGLAETLDRAIAVRDRPLHMMSEHGHVMLARGARPRVTVLLSGGGGDEVFGGYYFWLSRRTPENCRFFPWITRSSAPVPLERAASTHDVFEALVRPEFAVPAQVRDRLEGAFRDLIARAPTGDFVNRLGYLFLKLHLPEFMAVEERLSLAEGVEIRVPLVDAAVVELVAGYPSAAKLGPRGEKALLRDGPGATLPGPVRDRRKSPYPIPFDTDAFYRAARADLSRPALAIHRYFDRARLARFLEELELPGTGPRRHALFRLHSLERWHALGGARA